MVFRYLPLVPLLALSVTGAYAADRSESGNASPDVLEILGPARSPDPLPQIRNLQERIDSADEGTTLSLESGRYIGPFKIRKPLGLQAADGARVELAAAPGAGSVLSVKDVDGIGLVGIEFLHLKTSAAAEPDDPQPVVRLSRSRGTIRDCVYRDGVGTGLQVESASRFVIRNCRAHDNTRDGFVISSEGTWSALLGCEAEANGWNGIRFYDHSEGVVQKARSWRNAAGGILVDGGAGAIILDSVSEENAYRGITISQAARAEIRRCRLLGNKRDGIGVFYEDSVATATENLCESNMYNGIFVKQGARAALERNTCLRSEEGCGILVMDFGTYAVAEENICIQNGRDGMNFALEADGVIRHNTASRNKRYGITILTPGTNPEVLDNILEGNGEEDLNRRPQLHSDFDYDHEEVWWLLSERRYERLSEIATRVLNHPRQDEDGEWILKRFYGNLGMNTRESQYLEEHISRLEGWARQWPESPAPRIAIMNANVKLGWLWRGGGYADTVSEDGWRMLRKHLRIADNIARTLVEDGCTDPELYASWIEIGMADGTPKYEMGRRLQAGLAADPKYHEIYANYTQYLLPRWGGSPKELERFARESVQFAEGFEDQGIYARIVYWTLKREGQATLRKLYPFDYELADEGFAKLVSKYGESNFLINAWAAVACAWDDRERAGPLFEKIGHDRNSRAWPNRDTFEANKAWALGNGSAENKSR